MSEYYYYEFQAIDRPLDKAAQQALRSISSRARITATSFTNHYEWGDLKGDPNKFMERWFDLHLYMGNQSSRRLMIRLPKRLVDRERLAHFLKQDGWADVRSSGDNLIIDISAEDIEPDYEHWDDGSGWLAALAPLRADLLAGDFRMFYVLWLGAVQVKQVSDDEAEPLPGIAPLTGALEGFANFFEIDPDLLQAAAEAGQQDTVMPRDDLRRALAAIPEGEKTELLARIVEGHGHVGPELRARLRKKHTEPVTLRTVGALGRRAQEIADARKRADAERAEAEQRRQAKEAEKARRARLEALRRRGDKVWPEIEQEIARRNSYGYDGAVNRLSDLQALAAQEGNLKEFNRRLGSIRTRHASKGRFIERLNGLALFGDEIRSEILNRQEHTS